MLRAVTGRNVREERRWRCARRMKLYAAERDVGIMLLMDIRDIFNREFDLMIRPRRGRGKGALTTVRACPDKRLLEELLALEERPWIAFGKVEEAHAHRHGPCVSTSALRSARALPVLTALAWRKGIFSAPSTMLLLAISTAPPSPGCNVGTNAENARENGIFEVGTNEMRYKAFKGCSPKQFHGLSVRRYGSEGGEREEKGKTAVERPK